MREIFPAELWKGGSSYYVDHGSSYGRPWTEMSVYSRKETKDGCFYAFWRIDTDERGSYISFRLYKNQKGKWDSRYSNTKEHIMEYVKKDSSFSWDSKIDPGTKDSYKEADVIHFTIDKNSWASKGEQLKRLLRVLTTDIIEFLSTEENR